MRHIGRKYRAGVAAMSLCLILVLGAAAQEQPEQTPPAAQAPPTTQAPPADQTPSESAPPSATTPQSEIFPTTPPQPKKQTPKPLRKKKTKTTAKKTHVQSQTGKVVVRNGGSSDKAPQISPGMSQEQALHRKESTAKLLAVTDANVKQVAGRQLTPSQQSMLDQVNTYMRQSKAASDSGDVDRAHTLAFKAHLLSDELLRH